MKILIVSGVIITLHPSRYCKLCCLARHVFFLKPVRIFLTLFVLNIPIDNLDKYILVSNTCVASESKQIVPDQTALKSSLIWDDLFAYAFLD